MRIFRGVKVKRFAIMGLLAVTLLQWASWQYNDRDIKVFGPRLGIVSARLSHWIRDISVGYLGLLSFFRGVPLPATENDTRCGVSTGCSVRCLLC
jgi:hypothetical protein